VLPASLAAMPQPPSADRLVFIHENGLESHIPKNHEEGINRQSNAHLNPLGRQV
jgi:hypothetical protein